MAIVISQVQGGQRKYAGQTEAGDVLAYLKLLANTPTELTRFLEFLLPLVQWARSEDTCTEQDVQEALSELEDEVIDEVLTERALAIREGRVVVEAVSPRGKAVFAVFQLLLENRLSQFRECKHCGALFYARFKHQQFCGDRNKNCQWHHYHSPAWRKLNRERNRRHQREYRKRNPGRRH